jgi:hypothetical protein
MARVGRPLKFKTVEEMQEKIDAYFAVTPIRQLTITGLALALDTDRVTLIDYEKRDEYSNAVKTAKTRIENAYELTLRERGSSGDIFGLKNFGWTDKTETDYTSNGKEIGGITINVANIDGRLAELISRRQVGGDQLTGSGGTGTG